MNILKLSQYRFVHALLYKGYIDISDPKEGCNRKYVGKHTPVRRNFIHDTESALYGVCSTLYIK